MNSSFVLFSVVFSLFLVGSISSSFAASSVDVVENRMVTLVGEGIDPDGNDLKFNWVQLDGESVSLSSNKVAEPQFMAPEVANGQIKILNFQLTVTDPSGANAMDTIEIVVNPVNHPPKVYAGKDQVMYKNINIITLVSSVVDPDGDALTYSWKQIAGNPVELSSTTGKNLTILPNSIDFSVPDPLTFELTVEDGFGGVGTDSASVYPLTDLPSNRLIQIQAGPMQEVHEGETVTLTATGTTANGAPINYSWVQLIGTEAQLKSYTGPSVQFIAPKLPSQQPVILSFQVSGYSAGNGWATALALVKVLPVNGSPIADAGPDQSVSENVQVKLLGSGIDPDGDKIRFSWTQKSGMKLDLYEQTTFSVYFFTPKITTMSETVVFELTVTDPYGNTGKDDVAVTINSVNLPPRAFAGPDRKVIGGSEVTINGSAVDPENAPLTISWRQIAGEAVTFDKSNLSFSFKAPSVVSGESKRLIFELKATDSVNQSASDQVTIIVVPENSAPIVDAGSDMTGNENTSLNILCTAHDPDGDKVSYSWSSSNSNLVIANSASAGTSVQLPSVVENETITMTCTASDGRLSGSDSMKITVQNTLNLPIVADAGPDKIVNEQVKVSLDGSKSNDPENQKLSFMWTQTSGEQVVLSSTTSKTPSFTSPIVANGEIKVLVFELKVYDDNGREAVDSVTVTVDPINSPPTATATAKQS